jgi:hypothetical protein
MDLDMTESLAPKSDQLDAVDLLGGPRTFKIENVTKNNPEQPFNFHLEGFPRVWRPGKSMRRVIVAAWGGKVSAYVGHSVTLYCDDAVEFGGAAVGGTRISHMSGIGDKPLKVPLLIKKGRSAIYTVQPLKEAPAPKQQPVTPARDWAAEAAALKGSTDDLRALYMDAQANGADPDTLAHIKEQATA